MTSRPHATADQNAIDQLLTELIEAFRHTESSCVALSLCDELLGIESRDALRLLIRDRLDQLIPVATEPAACLICSLLELTIEPLAEKGRHKWMLTSDLGNNHPTLFIEKLDSYREAVLRTFPRKIWEAGVDQGIVRIRYWAWALVEALKSFDEISEPPPV